MRERLESLKDVRHVGPQLDLDADAGRVRPFRSAQRVVTQHLACAGLEEQRRQAREIAEQWRRIGRQHVFRREVVVAQADHCRRGEHRIALFVGHHARAAQCEIDERREHYGARRHRLAGCLDPVQEGEGEIAAGRVAGDDDVLGRNSLGHQPAPGRPDIVHALRETLFRRQPVVHHQRARPDPAAPARHHGMMQARELEHPGAAVDVEDDLVVARSGQGDPLGRRAVAIDGVHAHVRVDPGQLEIQRALFVAQELDFGVVAEVALDADAQDLVEPPAPEP